MGGFILWLLQTGTGLYLCAGLYLHLFETPLTGYAVFDYLFILSALTHGLNGLYSIIDESFRGRWWSTINAIKTGLTDLLLNRQGGHFMFMLHRVTGIYLLMFLLQHLCTNSLVSPYLSIDEAAVTNFLRRDIFAYAAVMSLGFHAFNGLRLIILELTTMTRLQREAAYLSLISGTLFIIYYMM